MPAGAVDNDRRVSRTTMRVIAICWVTIIFDGYDLIVYGAVVPDLLEYQQWSLSPEEAGTIGSYALFGMLVGALIAGTITDLVGRRRIILFCIAWFSLAMGLCAIAPSPELFGFFRFLAGLGLGGVVPTASAITIEYAPPARRKFLYALMFSGYSVGGILAATLAIFVVPEAGFRAMFAIGLAPLVLILPLAWKFLPESISFLLARGRRQEAEELARRYDIPMPAMEATTALAERGKLAPLASLFSRDYRVATGTFWAICFLMLLLVYGLNTWLAQLMKDAGYPLGSSLAFLATLNLGAIVGAISAGRAADRFGSKTVTSVGFLVGAVAIALLAFKPPQGLVYALLFVGGYGTIGTAMIVNAYVTEHYAAANRATALGWALGIGRAGAILGPTLGGILIGAGVALEWNFFFIALVGVAASVLCTLVPRPPVARPTPTTGSRFRRTPEPAAIDEARQSKT
jgi:AAHS family benzoate transporter-like MFS transporter